MRLRWTRHEDLAIKKRMEVRREEYLDHMTFRTLPKYSGLSSG